MTTELKRWGDEKPDNGRSIIIYRRDHLYGRWLETHEGMLMGIGTSFNPDPNARWCYVPSAPDWDSIK